MLEKGSNRRTKKNT